MKEKCPHTEGQPSEHVRETRSSYLYKLLPTLKTPQYYFTKKNEMDYGRFSIFSQHANVKLFILMKMCHKEDNVGWLTSNFCFMKSYIP